MATTYESSANDIMASLDQSNLSTATTDSIKQLLVELGGAATVTAVAQDITAANIAELAGDSNIIMMSGDTKANVVFDANSPVQAITVGAAGGSDVKFETSKDVTVALQGGLNDNVATGAGNDVISIQGGSATVDTGTGNDTVAITGGDANISAMEGDLTVYIGEGAVGNATIDAGSGFDQVNVVSTLAEHVFSFINGMFHMNSDYELQMQNVNIVTFQENPGSGVVDTATVLADTAADSLTAKLYQVALGRDDGGLDAATDGQLGGLKFWQDTFAEQNPESGLQHTVYSFLNCDEFHSAYDAMSNEDYVAALFGNLGLSADATIGGKSLADYVAAINGNADAMTGRYDVAWAIAASQETVDIIGAAGEKYVIDAGGLDFENPLA